MFVYIYKQVLFASNQNQHFLVEKENLALQLTATDLDADLLS